MIERECPQCGGDNRISATDIIDNERWDCRWCDESLITQEDREFIYRQRITTIGLHEAMAIQTMFGGFGK